MTGWSVITWNRGGERSCRYLCLEGLYYAMRSGILAAHAIYASAKSKKKALRLYNKNMQPIRKTPDGSFLAKGLQVFVLLQPSENNELTGDGQFGVLFHAFQVFVKIAFG